MPTASHGNTDGHGPPGRPVKSTGWVDEPNASPVHLKAQRVKKEPPIPVPRVAHPKGNAPLLSVGGEWALKECEEHTTWVNEILKHQDYHQVEDLRRGCSDGVTLVHITELLCNERPSGIHGLPVLKSHKIQNVVQCLNLLESRGVEVEAIKAEELVEGNLKTTLLLMNNIRAKFDSRPICVAFSGQPSSSSSYSPQSSTPSNWTEKPKAMPGSEFINGGLEMLPGIMGDKEETATQIKNPVPKMSTTEMDAHGVLQHQHMRRLAPDSPNTPKSTPLRGGGHTPIGFNQNQLSLPNTMTVEDKLKSLLTNNNNHTYDDGELLLPPPPKDRSESFEDDVFENSAFSPDLSPDMTVMSAGPRKPNAQAGYVPSKPGERRYGPRGEVILDRHYRPPPPYRPRNKPPNQSPPRQLPQTPGSPNRRNTPELRDACNRMYGTPPQAAPQGHLLQRQPPPYMPPTDANRMRRPTVPPRNTPVGPSSNSYDTPEQHKPSVAPRGPPQKIYAVPNNKTLGRDMSPNRDRMGRDVLPNRPGMRNDVSPKRDGIHQDVSPNRSRIGQDTTPSSNRNGAEVGLRPDSRSHVEIGEGQDKLNTRVMFDSVHNDESRDWFSGGNKGPGPPPGQGGYGPLQKGDVDRPVDAEYIEIKMESSGARVDRGDGSPDRRSPRGDSVRLQMAEVTRSESYRLENRNRPPDEVSGQQKDPVRQESLRIPNIDMTRNDSFRAENREGEMSFMAQGDVARERGLGKANVKDSGLSYTVGTIQERQASTGQPHVASRRPDQNDSRIRDEIDMVAMHNLSMESVKKDKSFDETTRQRHSVSEIDQNRNSMDGHQHYRPGFSHDRSFDNGGPQDGRQFGDDAARGAFRQNDGQNMLQHGSVPPQGQGHVPYQDRRSFSRPEQHTSFDGSSSLSSDNLPKLGDPFQDIMFDNGLPNIRDFEFSGSEFSSRSVTPPLPPLSPSNTPPQTPPLVHSPRTGFGPPRTKILSPRQNTPSSRFPQGARKTPDLLSNMDKFTGEVFIDGPGAQNQISITPPGSPHGKYKVWTNPYTPGRVSLPSPKQRRKKRASKSGKKSLGHHVSFDIDGSTDDTYDQNDSSGSADPVTSSSNIVSPAHVPNSNNQEIALIQKQLDGLETMYQEILKILGVEKDYLPPGPDGKGRPRVKHRRPPTSKEIKNISKRFGRLESHVVTLARSVAHLSSEMRSQNMIFQDLEALKQEVKALKEHRSPGSYYGANEWERFRGWVPSLTNPKRVEKLKRFFGQEPPLLRLFLKKLGYEKYATNFDTERIGMVELPYMTEQRLQSIGIPMGPRLRILQEAQLCFRQENFNIYIV